MRFSKPSPLSFANGRLLGSMQGRKAVGMPSPCAGTMPPNAAMTAHSSKFRQILKAGPDSFLQLLHVCLLDVAIRSPFKIRIESIGILHDHRAGLEARHSLVQPPFGDGLYEVRLAEGLEALEQRRTDEPLLIGAVTTIASRRPPGAKAVHGNRINLDAVDDLVGMIRCRGLILVLRLCGQCRNQTCSED